MIYDFFKIRGVNEKPFWDFRVLSTVLSKKDSVSAVTDRPTDNTLESLYKMQGGKSEELTLFYKVYAHETTFGDSKDDY